MTYHRLNTDISYNELSEIMEMLDYFYNNYIDKAVTDSFYQKQANKVLEIREKLCFNPIDSIYLTSEEVRFMWAKSVRWSVINKDIPYTNELCDSLAKYWKLMSAETAD